MDPPQDSVLCVIIIENIDQHSRSGRFFIQCLDPEERGFFHGEYVETTKALQV